MKIRPEVAASVRLRIRNARTFLQMAENALGAEYTDEMLAAISLSRSAIDDAVQCLDAGKMEVELLEHGALAVASQPLVKNDTSGKAS